MTTDDPRVLPLRRLKWSILGTVTLLLTVLEAYYYFVRGVPLVKDVVDWLIGMGIAVVVLEITFRILERAQNRLLQEIAERRQAEEALREYSERLEEMVDERTQKLRVAQRQVVQKERLAVLGQLADGVGHELRNPLGVISNAVYYLQMTLGDAGSAEVDETTKEYLDIISAEIRKADKIVSDLLDFSRTKPVERKKISVSDLVAQVLEKRLLPQNVEALVELPAELPSVSVDPRQMEQVLVNLLDNACQAMPEGGRVVLSARAGQDEVALSIADAGCGIPEENIGKLFEPLFTTKARGIGLGLAVSKNLLEVNGGSIEVTSEEGKGSIFTIKLPTKEAIL